MPKSLYLSLGLACAAFVLALIALVMSFQRLPYEQVARGVAYEVIKESAPMRAQSVKETVNQALSDAGLAGDELNKRMEQAIIAFIKSRAQDDGQPSGQAAAATAQDMDVAPIDPKIEPVAGTAAARYQLIVYSDYECPFCKHFWPTLQSVMDQYGGRLAITLRDYPLPSHGRAALREAVAAQCAFRLGGNEAFWAYSDRIYTQTGSNGQGLGGKTPLLSLAKEVGLDANAFQHCLDDDDGTVQKAVQATMDRASKEGVHGTPTSVLIDTRTGKSAVVRGAQPLSVVTSALDNLLGDEEGAAQ